MEHLPSSRRRAFPDLFPTIFVEMNLEARRLIIFSHFYCFTKAEALFLWKTRNAESFFLLRLSFVICCLSVKPGELISLKGNLSRESANGRRLSSRLGKPPFARMPSACLLTAVGCLRKHLVQAPSFKLQSLTSFNRKTSSSLVNRIHFVHTVFKAQKLLNLSLW